MKLCATMGLQWDKANLDYLVDGQHVVGRHGEAFWGGVSMSLNRPRLPEPLKDGTSTDRGAGR